MRRVASCCFLRVCSASFSRVGASLTRFICCAQKSKDCPYKFATKLPAPSGNATWHVPEKIPDSTVYIRAWLWTEQADGTFTQTNYGRTKGNWQVCVLSVCIQGS